MIWTALFAILGGLWRRVMGGMFSLPRWAVMAASPVLVLPWLSVGPWWFLCVAGLSALFWTPGHDFSNDRALLLRYGPFGLAWIACRKWWRWRFMGWTEAAEVLAGFSFYLTVNGASLLLA